MNRDIEIRIKRTSTPAGEWADIKPVKLTVDDTMIETVVKAVATADVVEVRWNYAGQVSGLGQGHYSPGPAHPHYARAK